MLTKYYSMIILLLLLSGCGKDSPPAAESTAPPSAKATAHVAWEIPLTTSFIHNPLVVPSFIVVAADDQGVVHAVNSGPGTTRWTSQLTHPINQIVGDDQIVYAVSYLKTRAIAAQDGATLWEQPLKGGVFALAPFEETPLIVRAEGAFHAFDAHTGAPGWTLPATGSLTLCNLAAPRFYYFNGGQLHAADRSTGDVLWSATSFGGCLFAAPEIPILWSKTMVEARDGASGTVLWSRQGDLEWALPVGKRVYVMESDGLHALDGTTGAEYWTSSTLGKVAMIEGDDQTAYIYLRDGTLMAVNQADGQPLWSQRLAAPSAAQPWRYVDAKYVYIQPSAELGAPITLVQRSDGAIFHTFELPVISSLPAFAFASFPQGDDNHLYVVYATKEARGGILAIDMLP